MSTKKFQLPEKIHVRILRHDSGVGFFAELPEYRVFTEASSQEELDEMINDLIYELFSVPKKLQNQVKYGPAVSSNWSERLKSLDIMATPNLLKNLNVT
ncbi:hypothetical protein H3C70_04095 [Patescibacteria group bacterium]|nr:hypothetical protein [Patescibacteria group bacterium]